MRHILVAPPRVQQKSERKVLGQGQGQGRPWQRLEGVVWMSIRVDSVVHESNISGDGGSVDPMSMGRRDVYKQLNKRGSVFSQRKTVIMM